MIIATSDGTVVLRKQTGPDEMQTASVSSTATNARE